jgi:hypothetical protein
MLQCYVLTFGRSVTAFSAPPRSQRPGQGPRSPHPKAGPGRTELECKDVFFRIQGNRGQFLDQLSVDLVLKKDCSPHRKHNTMFGS